MTLWLLYDRQDIEKNIRYIEMYRKACEERAVTFSLIVTQKLSMTVCEGKITVLYEDQPVALPEAAVCRDRNPLLTKQLEYAGIKVFNNSFVADLGNDKAKAYQYFAHKRIPMMNSCFCKKDAYRDCFPYPVVVKSCCGHGGSEVFLVKNRQEYENACRKIRSEDVVVQEVASEVGKDLRVYVIGKEIIACILRQSDCDFRSNFSLGGRTSVYTLKEKEKELVETIIGLFDFGLVGIDFVFHHGEMRFNEIEDVVGARMLYKNTDVDLVGKYLDHILGFFGKNAPETK